MNDIPSETFVDPNTDDLDAFNQLLNGNAKVKEVEKEVEVETPEEVDAEIEDTPEDDENDPLASEEEEVLDDQEEEDEGPPKLSGKKNKKTAQERINELTAKVRQKEREFEALLAKLDAPKQEQKPEVKPEPKGEPTPDDLLENGDPKYALGEFDPAFIRDLTRFTFAQEAEATRIKEEETRALQEKQENERQLATEWQGKLTKAAEKYEDFFPKIAALEADFGGLDPAYGEYLAKTIMSLDYGTDVLNYLAENRAEAQRIANLGAAKATIALGRIEARFFEDETEEEKPKPVLTRAPAPPPSLNRGSSGNSGKAVRPDTDDLAEFERTFFKK